MEFADFSVYNAGLENREWFVSKADLTNCKVSEKEVSRSPTTSSITSGYFSHSASNATLSDMGVPCSDSSDQLAGQTKEADSGEHPGPPVGQDFRPSLTREVPEPDRGLVKGHQVTPPPKENSALAKGSPGCPQVAENDSRPQYRTNSCSDGDIPDASKNGPVAREFCSREVTVEHTTAILEDYSFTEFMGVSDGKDFDGLPDSPAGGEPLGRRTVPNRIDRKSISDGTREPGRLHSSAENDQVNRCYRGFPMGSGFPLRGSHCTPTPPGSLGTVIQKERVACK